MIRALALRLSLSLSLLATQAAALTCAPPDPARTFQAAQESPDRYTILFGRLAFDPRDLPESGEPAPPYTPPPGYEPPHGAPDTLAAPVEARFEGFALGLEGFTRPVSETIRLQPACAGPWCGGIGAEGAWLLFARETSQGREVLLSPCGGWAFENPSEAVLARMAACLRGEACEAP